jgi:hypothetical protein
MSLKKDDKQYSGTAQQGKSKTNRKGMGVMRGMEGGRREEGNERGRMLK